MLWGGRAALPGQFTSFFADTQPLLFGFVRLGGKLGEIYGGRRRVERLNGSVCTEVPRFTGIIPPDSERKGTESSKQEVFKQIVLFRS